jgi:hypothetical protein
LAPLRNKDWVVYAKRPFGGPEEVLRYLARYTHRVAISSRRLISLDDKGVTLKWEDYRLDGLGGLLPPRRNEPPAHRRRTRISAAGFGPLQTRGQKR